MCSASNPRIGEVLPSEAWKILETDPEAVLIDVRTRAEWAFVGLPDLGPLGKTLVQAEWVQLPDMSRNPHFVGEVMEQLGDFAPRRLLFLCRSGARSLKAAEAVDEYLGVLGQEAECINVLTGFEGDLDDNRHRGVKNGWKVEGLAWRQS